jgi:hypothetical protein
MERGHMVGRQLASYVQSAKASLMKRANAQLVDAHVKQVLSSANLLAMQLLRSFMASQIAI